MREPLVINRANYRQIVFTLRNVWKQIRYFNAGLAVFLKRSLRAKNNGFSQFPVLKIFVSEAGRGMLTVKLCQERFRIERIHLTRTALHEE
ncbi:MAG: hypothetical protein WKF37_07710 [Bryobacteraceae bacterium]